MKSKENLRNKHMLRYKSGIVQKFILMSPEFSSNQFSANVVQTNNQKAGKAQIQPKHVQLKLPKVPGQVKTGTTKVGKAPDLEKTDTTKVGNKPVPV